MRQIVLDTETTGLDPAQGHRVIEIGCVELVNRRASGKRFHQYLQPDREIDAGAVEVHGITTAFLADKPRFAEIAAEFIEFIKGAELVIHNAPFDIGFLNHELARLADGFGTVGDHCSVIDTLALARQLHSGQKNNLDALCKRYFIDNSQRELHGALLDAEILADVYLAMTGGQATLSLDGLGGAQRQQQSGVRHLAADRPPLVVIHASAAESEAHALRLAALEKSSAGQCVWQRLTQD
ncbi:MAG: DNA polymerase III subunit epsilon [Gammaproteobacteria bacterium]